MRIQSNFQAKSMSRNEDSENIHGVGAADTVKTQCIDSTGTKRS